jgi:hypothetical protein
MIEFKLILIADHSNLGSNHVYLRDHNQPLIK